MLQTHINCAVCGAPLGDLQTHDGIAVKAIILKCNKCKNGLGGYYADGYANPKQIKKRKRVHLHE